MKKVLEKRTRLVPAVVLASMLGAAAVALAAGDFRGAESKAKDFRAKQEALRKLAPEQARGLVTAICEADEDDRKTVAKDASSRAKDKVTREFDQLEDLKDEAQKKLDEVIKDGSLTARHDAARDYKADIDKRWASIVKMTKAIRGANHPVVAWMLERGQEEHKKRQTKCDAAEVDVGKGRADCLMATGSTCLVIELKPKNRKAIKGGKDQAEGYAKALNDELAKTGSAIIKKLVGIDSDFAKCKKFTPRVDCYTLCPSIDDDGEFRAVSVDWDEDCR